MVETISKLYEEKNEYKDFKIKLKEVLLECMTSTIVVNNNNSLECVILNGVDSDKLVDSEFFYKLILSEKIVKELYAGNTLVWFYIFHELERIFQRYLIFNCKCDVNIIKIIKEMIINSSGNEWECVEKNIDNSFLSEIIANKRAFYNLMLLYRKLGQKIAKDELTSLKEKLNVSSAILYVENELYFIGESNEAIEIDDLFDKFIYFYPKWLDIFPQLQIEYFEDNNGHVVKSDFLELMDIYKDIEDEDEKRYTLHLIDKEKKEKIRILN